MQENNNWLQYLPSINTCKKWVRNFFTATDVLVSVGVFVGLNDFIRQREKEAGHTDLLPEDTVLTIELVAALCLLARQWNISARKAAMVQQRRCLPYAVQEQGVEEGLLNNEAKVDEEIGAGPQQPLPEPVPYTSRSAAFGRELRRILWLYYNAYLNLLFQASVHTSTPSIGKPAAIVVSILSSPLPLGHLIVTVNAPEGLNPTKWQAASRERKNGAILFSTITSIKAAYYYAGYGILMLDFFPGLDAFFPGAIAFVGAGALATLVAQFPRHLDNFLETPRNLKGGPIGFWEAVGEFVEMLLRTAYMYQFSREPYRLSVPISAVFAVASLIIDGLAFFYDQCFPYLVSQPAPEGLPGGGRVEPLSPQPIERKQAVPRSSSSMNIAEHVGIGGRSFFAPPGIGTGLRQRRSHTEPEVAQSFHP